MEVYSFYAHAALCHHESCDRAVDAAGHKDESLAVRSERKSAESLYLVTEYICGLAPYIDCQKAVRPVNIDAQDLAGLEDHAADLFCDLRRLHGEGFVGSVGLDLEGLYPVILYDLLHEFTGDAAYLVYIFRCLYRRAYRCDSEYPYALRDDLIFRDVCRDSYEHESVDPLCLGVLEA